MTPVSDGTVEIVGLEWSDLWNIANGPESAVIPIPGLRPTNIVFKGDDEFSYGHFGVHLGQVDRLVFLGPTENQITAHFIDCRDTSPTFGNRLTVKFSPSATRLLTIPPGVAHTFDTRAISTLNLYSMMLPDPTDWLTSKTQWTVKGDIVNVKMDVLDEDIPRLTANSKSASETFFKLIASEQREALANLSHEYPFTEDVEFEDGGKERIKFWKRLEKRQLVEAWTPIEGIDGAGWAANLVVWTGDVSGYVPLLDRRPKHLIDHGQRHYSHDAFGVHLGGDDHLIFVGPTYRSARCELVDFRRGSPTLHKAVTFEFSADPKRTLVIPRGVAHRFENLEGIFTINQPLTFLPVQGDYEPGHDVIDWPIHERPFPVLDIQSQPATDEYYEALAAKQRMMLSSPSKHSTPAILLRSDAEGNQVKVVIRSSV